MNEYTENWNEFDDWFKKLQKISIELFGITNLSSKDCKDYFNDGYTPKEALNENLSNG